MCGNVSVIVEEALALADRSRENYYQAELYRLKGELLLRHPVAGAEDCFNQAIKIVQRQKKSLELRTTMNLARLYHDRCRSEEARIRFARIYNVHRGIRD